MSRLTEALESFYNLLCLEYPEIAASLQPGLPRSEIDEKVKNLQFSLPEEVYELYQWRNGMQKNIFFALCDNTGIGEFFAIDMEQKGSPVIRQSEIYLYDLEEAKFCVMHDIVYSSLIDLVSVITECYEKALLPSSSKIEPLRRLENGGFRLGL